MFSRRTLVWVAPLVVVLVAIDVVLVALALSRTAPAENGPAGPVPTFSSTPIPSASGTPKPSASATTDSAGTITSGRRLLSAVDAQEAWRATGGVCGGSAGVLERSIDGGTTWQQVALGDDAGAVFALRAGTNAVSVVVGTGKDCTPTVRTTTDDGAIWIPGAAGAAGAGIGPDGLILASGSVESPCVDPVQAFQGERTTAVVCDGSIEWRTGIADWVIVPVKGVRSLAVNGNAYTLARAGATDCPGVQITSMPASEVTAETSVTPIGCAEDADAQSALVLASSGAALWLWAGDEVLVSNDGGVTW